MAAGHKFEDEYRYFNTFVKHTSQKFSHDDTLNLLQLQSYTLELMEETFHEDKKKPFHPDKDSIKFQCAYIMSLIFSICQGPSFRFIFPCLSTRLLTDRYNDQSTEKYVLNKRLIRTSKNMVTSYAKFMEYPWDRSQEMMLQESIYEFVALIWKISGTASIHDLLILRIQTYGHPHIVSERYHTKIQKPYMAYTYNEFEITKNSANPGWKYYWNPRSHTLLELLSNDEGTSFVEYGVAYSLEDLVDKMREAILTKIYSSKTNEKDLISSLSRIFQLQTDEIDIRDKNSLIWPVLQHTYCLGFEDIFNSLYFKKLEVNNKDVQTSGETTQTATTDQTFVTHGTQASEQSTTHAHSATITIPVPDPNSDETQETEYTNSGRNPSVIDLQLDPDNIDLDTLDIIDLSSLGLNVITSDGPGF